MRYEEFGSLQLDAVGKYARKVRRQGLISKAELREALEVVEQMATEQELRYVDGCPCTDSQLRSRLAVHYGDEREITYLRKDLK